MALKLLRNGRWQNTETGRFAKAPVLTSSGRYRDANTGRFVKVQTPTASGKGLPLAAKAAVKPIKSNIISGEEFVEKYGGYPKLEYSSSEALTFKRGVANRTVTRETSRRTQIKIRKMDADNLLQLYNEEQTMFDLYFAYPGDDYGESGYYSNEEYDIAEILVEKYEKRFGAIK